MSTVSTDAILKTLRDRMLSFAPAGGGATLGSRLSSRMYQGQAPDNAPFRYGVMRLVNRRSGGDGSRSTADLEVMLYGRGAASAIEVERDADLVDQAFQHFREASTTVGADGLIFAGEWTRDTIPQIGDSVDRDVSNIRIVQSLVLYPRYLTQYA